MQIKHLSTTLEFVKDGVGMGLDHDLFRLLQKEGSFEIRQQILPWQGLLAGVATGQYDVALSAGIITDERVKSLTFTMPIAPGTHFIVMRKGENRIKTIADLNGLTVGVQQGSAQYQALPELQEILEKRQARVVGIDEADPAGKDDIVNATLKVPVGKPILLILRSRDVIHNFFVRELRMKQDIVPGMEIPFHFQADKIGTYEVPCSELCGLGHSQMRTTMEVMTEENFEKWKKDQAAAK